MEPAENGMGAGEDPPDVGGGAPRSALTLGGGGPGVQWDHTAATSSPERAGRRLRRGWPLLLAALAGLAVAVASIAMLGGGGSGNAAASGPVARAAYATSREPGFKFSMNIATSVGGQSYAVEGTGSMNPLQREGSINVQASGITVQELIKGSDFYVKLPSAAAAGGKEWIRVNINAPAQALGVNPTAGTGTDDPAQLLDFLKASGQVSTLGTQSVDAVPTTHYHALVDLERYAANAPPGERAAVQESADALKRISGSSLIPIDIWVDSAQRVRRLSMGLDLCSPAGQISESVSMDFFDFGAQPPVTVPAESQVTDVSGAVQSGLSHAAQQLSC